MNNEINYEIKISNIKTLRMHFNKQGKLLISIPLGIKDQAIISFVEKNQNWIKEKYQLVNNKQIKYQNDTTHYFLGKAYTLKINYSKTNRVDLIDHLLMVSTNDFNQVRKLIISYRYEICDKIFNEILYQCYLKMEKLLKKYPQLIIKESKNKWGCCYINKNQIMLNLALSQASIEEIEYVIFHELVHFIVANHSKEFHQILQLFVPNEREIAKRLKTYSSLL